MRFTSTLHRNVIKKFVKNFIMNGVGIACGVNLMHSSLANLPGADIFLPAMTIILVADVLTELVECVRELRNISNLTFNFHSVTTLQ